MEFNQDLLQHAMQLPSVKYCISQIVSGGRQVKKIYSFTQHQRNTWTIDPSGLSKLTKVSGDTSGQTMDPVQYGNSSFQAS